MEQPEHVEAIKHLEPSVDESSVESQPNDESHNDIGYQTNSASEDGNKTDYRARSPYNPDRYKCTGYGDDEWEYFDGRGQDMRFTIDLEGGTTDRLRDVRPFLFYVGFWSGSPSHNQPELEKLEPAVVEEEYVKLGRQYLIQERERKRGYFLAARDWAAYNDGRYEGFPFGWLVHSDPGEGDQGFETAQDCTEYFDDCCRGVLKTNVRTPLPDAKIVRTTPKNRDWDLFVQWIYAPSRHGAMDMLDQGWGVRDVVQARLDEGCRLEQWLMREEDSGTSDMHEVAGPVDSVSATLSQLSTSGDGHPVGQKEDKVAPEAKSKSGRRRKKADPDYPARSPYNPERYRCSGYDDSDWVFFDGSPEKGKDQRFTIDLEGGSMDRLRDVRPYLYYVGYYCSEPTKKQPELEKKDRAEWKTSMSSAVGSTCFRSGKGRYFLAKRDWAQYNQGNIAGWPFQRFVGSVPEEGDVGFEECHEIEQFEEDCEGHVIKTNIRSPLPEEHTLTTFPGDPRWDEFIRWIYNPEIHGALLMRENWYWREIERNRIVRGTGFCNWLNKRCLEELI